MTKEEFLKEKDALVKQYETFKERENQVLGAIMWINQTLEKMEKAYVVEARSAENDQPGGPEGIGQLSGTETPS